MILTLLIGRKDSTGFPKKNLLKINNKYLFEYPIEAALKTKLVDKTYVSTDCPVIKKRCKKRNIGIIDRPKKLASKKALGEDAFKHGYVSMLKKENLKEKDIEFIILLFANAVTINSKLIKKGVSILRKNSSIDSAVSVSKYNMWSPLRARKLNNKNLLEPFVPFETFGNPKTLNCDRDSQGDVWFADMGVSIVRPRCFNNMGDNLLPQKWMGKKIAPIFSEAGFDLDYEWQLPGVNYWLDNYYENK